WASFSLPWRASRVRVTSSGSEASGTALAVAWPRGEAAACKAVYTGSNPVATSDGRQQCRLTSAIGAAVARFLHTEEVTGSIPVSRTGTTRFRCNNRIERDGAAVARFPDTEEVTGSIPVSRTEQAPGTPPGASCIPRRPRGADERATCGCCVAGLAREHHAERDPFASTLVLYTTAITSEHLCLLLRTPTDRATVHPVRIRTVRTRTTNRRARPTTA